MRFLSNSLLRLGVVSTLLVVPGFLLSLASADTPSDTLCVLGTCLSIPEPPGGDAVPEPPITLPGPGPNAAVILLEPGGGISDVIISTGNSYSLYSDPVTITEHPAPIATIPETGALQDISQYFDLSPGSVLVRSDVPEAGLLGMLAVALAGLGTSLRWRKLAK